jgi:hypothetical protein
MLTTQIRFSIIVWQRKNHLNPLQKQKLLLNASWVQWENKLILVKKRGYQPFKILLKTDMIFK